MKNIVRYTPILLAAAIVHLKTPPLYAASGVPAEWSVSQDVHVPALGLTRIRLPLETLGSAQPSLADLRLFDSAGKEQPYFIDQPAPVPIRDLPLERMTALMRKKETVITGMVPHAMRDTGFESVTLFTPTDDFLKPISLEGSSDGVHWKRLIDRAPIFKQTGDAMSSTVRFAPGSWSYIRITLDDSDTPPLRISQIRLYAPGHPIQDLQEFEPSILEMASDGHRTEIRLQLPAEGLPIHAIRLDVPETTFRRQVRVSQREFSAGEFRQTPLSQGSLYRVTLGSQKTEQTTIPIGQKVMGRQITLILENGDSPPLTIKRVVIKIIPQDLVFDAPAAGVYTLCSGNPKAAARSYDVASLRGTMNPAVFKKAVLGGLQPNLQYQTPPATSSEGAEEGSDINVDPWLFRKKVVAEPLSDLATLWRIELDPEAVAHNGGRLEALRLVRKDHQLPYVIDYAGVERSVAPGLEPQPAPAPGKSQWVITLPYAGMPITRLHVTVPDPLFQRTMNLYEIVEATPDRAEDTSKRQLATATWTRLRPGSPASFELLLGQMPRTARLILETDNGDNAPIHLETLQAYYQAPRLLFRSKPHTAPIYLYYGQPQVAAPQYDLNLIAYELLATPPQEARLGPEEALKATPWWEAPMPAGRMKYAFWILMGLVVLGLLSVIAKLLPPEKA